MHTMDTSTGNMTSIEDVSISIEDDDIHNGFANILRRFRMDFGSDDLRSITAGFKMITVSKLMKTFEVDPNNASINNWILEFKFWSILEGLLDVKFHQDLLCGDDKRDNSSANSELPIDLKNLCEYSSETVITDQIISADSSLLQLYTVMKTLSDTFSLDFQLLNSDINMDNLNITKWLATLNKINSFNRDPKLIKELDADAPLRSNLEIDEDDKSNDERFFSKAFELLISNNLEELQDLCQNTNNWDFALMIAGLQDRIDPVIDLDDYSNSTRPSGVKNKLLRKRTIYQLLQNEKMGLYEKACYSFLSNDFVYCNEPVDNWEQKLYLYLNNLLNIEVENKELKIIKRLGFQTNLIDKLPSPPIMSENINDILNKLNNDSNSNIRDQSKHPIRVLIGSVISDNVQTLMNNTIKSIDDLNSNDEIMNDTFILRVLTHLSIILQLTYGEKIISNYDYTKLLKCYILRLILYKKYELVPIYISFIPSDEIIQVYSHLLFQFDYESTDRIPQIENMRNLDLPLENILRKTMEIAFRDTAEYYPTNVTVQLIYDVEAIDEKLYSTIFWFIDAHMYSDCLEVIVILLRRFLLVGKIASAIKFLETVSLPKLIDNYKYKVTIIEDDNDELILPDFKLLELRYYNQLFTTFKKLLDSNDKAEDINVEKFQGLVKSLNAIVREWLFPLVNYEDDEVSQDDVETYKELRRIYLPTLFNALFDLLISKRQWGKKNVRDAMDLVNLLADEKYKLYEIFNSTNELQPFMEKLSKVGCQLFGEYKEGVYVDI
ncbi:unnamed protein product [Pichia kudriavzevii]